MREWNYLPESIMTVSLRKIYITQNNVNYLLLISVSVYKIKTWVQQLVTYLMGSMLISKIKDLAQDGWRWLIKEHGNIVGSIVYCSPRV